MKRKNNQLFGDLDRRQLLPFFLILCCYALWGFSNDITPIMASSFSKVFNLNTFQGSLVTIANHLGYLVMAIPAALYIYRYNFKSGIIVGLAIYAVGTLLFLPSKYIGSFTPFVFCYFVTTCGLAFLETCCNPMIYCMGNEESGIGRLNLAQAINALGALVGMFVVRDVVQAGISPLSSAIRSALPHTEFEIVKNYDLNILVQPYVIVSAIAILLLTAFSLQKAKYFNDGEKTSSAMQESRQLILSRNYLEALVTQFFYVGAQVCCWAYIIQYGVRIFVAEGVIDTEAEHIAQKYNIAAMVMFAGFRFLCAWLMKIINPDRLLAVMAIIAGVFTSGVILFTDRNGLYCLIVVSACMSLMFPTIYGIALRGMGKNVKLASAGMTMSVFGGAVFAGLQALIIDSDITIMGLSSTNLSFLVPLLCFIVVALFGHRSYVRHNITHDYQE